MNGAILTPEDIIAAMTKETPAPPPRGRTLEQLNAETELARYFERCRIRNGK